MRRMAAFIFICLLPLACERSEPLLQELSGIANPHDRWEALRLSNYSVAQKPLRICRAPHWYKVIVEDQRVSEVLGLKGQKVPLTSEIMSIDQIFDRLEQLRAQQPEKLQVEYEAQHSHPARIKYNYSPTNATNDRLALTLRDHRREP